MTLIRTALSIIFVFAHLSGCGGGDDDSSASTTPSSGPARISATSYSTLLSNIQQQYPNVVPAALVAELATYTAGEEIFRQPVVGTWWQAVKRFDATGNVRMVNFTPVNAPASQVFGANLFMGFWAIDTPVPNIPNRLGTVRTYGSPNQLVAPALAANFAWGYLPGYVPGAIGGASFAVVTEGLVYDQNGVAQGRTLNIYSGQGPFEPGRQQFGRYRSYVLENFTNTRLTGLSIDHDVMVSVCVGSLTC